MPYIDNDDMAEMVKLRKWLERNVTAVRAALAGRVAYWEAQLADFEPQLAALKADPQAQARLDGPAPDGSVSLMSSRGFETAVSMFRDQLRQAQLALNELDAELS